MTTTLFTRLSAILILSLALLPAAPARATVIDPSIAGNSDYDGWDGFSSFFMPGYGSFFTATNPWPAPIGSNLAGSGNAEFNKITGAGYVASASVYSPEASGTFVITDTSPVADLANVIFQIEIGPGDEGVFNGPVLNYNGASQQLAATLTHLVEQVYNGTQDTGEGEVDVFIDTWLYQWDLSSIVGPISDFQILWSVGSHSQTYALRLDQSDTYEAFAAAAVPEPASLALLGLGALGVMRRRRR